jgi:Putative beta-barrel porin-2, OmpL-like. bbp2
MRTFGRTAVITPLALMFLGVLCPGRLLADGDGKSEAPKVKLSTVEAPAPLTERERMLLDRVEQLEQRVAELEAKSSVSATRASETGAMQPAAPNAASGRPTANTLTASAARSDASAAPTDVSAVTPNGGSTPVSTAVAGATPAPIGPPQATEKGKSGAAKPQASEPFSFADFTWLNGNSRTKDTPYATSFFSPEIRADVDYNYSFNHPKDDTIGGSSEVFRHGEVHVTQLGVGGDFHYDDVRARLMTQFGLYSQTTPRNDASPARGQWNLDNAYRYVSEAYGGYHFNVLHGINVDAGIFMSYIGLFSYYQFDN